MAAHVQISFLRSNTLPAGARLAVYWNGTQATNGDGVAPVDPAESVDEQNPLTPAPIAIWPTGKAGFAVEPYGTGAFGAPANYGIGFGYGTKPFGLGPFGVYVDLFAWTTASVLRTLRDGLYTFAVAVLDQYGNHSALTQAQIDINGTPRPPANVEYVGSQAGFIELSWTHSPDLQTGVN